MGEPKREDMRKAGVISQAYCTPGRTIAPLGSALECRCSVTNCSAGGNDGGIVAEAGKPVHEGLLAEPGELALGVVARGLGNGFCGGSQGDGAFEVRAQFAVSDEVEWLCMFGTPLRIRPATSSSQPRSSIVCTRRSMRSYSAARGGCRPILIGPYPSRRARPA